MSETRYALRYADGSMNVLTVDGSASVVQALDDALSNYTHDESIQPELVRLRIDSVEVVAQMPKRNVARRA